MVSIELPPACGLRRTLLSCRNRMKSCIVSILVFCLCHVQTAFSLTVSLEKANKVGEKIWKNECAGSIEGLTHWNKGENFASLGIGHFIWYSCGKKEGFKETFPDLLVFLEQKGASLPNWLKTAKGCPWNSREEFYDNIQSDKMKSLRQFLFDTKSLQAMFMANRLDESFTEILKKCLRPEAKKITILFNRLNKEANGLYALIDYLNFKGDGLSSTETYKGQGWGLLQVLREMSDSSDDVLKDFVRAAKTVLEQRVKNAPPERKEAQWLKGWFNRLDTYLSKEQRMILTAKHYTPTAKEKLFQTPSLISAKISPEGTGIAYVGADEAGVANLFFKQSAAPVQVTFFKDPEIIQFFWSAKSDKIVLLKDANGTGQLHVHGVDIATKQQVIYTEQWGKINAKVIRMHATKNSAVIGLNHRNLPFHDLYVLDLDSGQWTLLFKNDSYAKFLVSDDLDLVLKMRINPDGSWTIFTADDSVFMQLSAAEAFHTDFLSYHKQIDSVYLLDNRYADTQQLMRKSLSDGAEQLLGGQEMSDIAEVLFLEGQPKAYAIYYTHKQWHCIDEALEKDISFLEKHIGAEFSVLSQSQTGDIWALVNNVPDRGSLLWIYDRKKQTVSPFHPTGLIATECYAKMYPLVIEARDGLKLVCYYTLPKEQDRGGYVERPLPLVVNPHGGPFKVRDEYVFNPYHQWLASRGYAVLSVNFRLSSGFGKAFVNAGNGEWGKKAHFDVIDAVEACIAKGIADRQKLAVFGGSYGGYESLASLTFTPEYFTCCVAICGPSNLKTVLDHVPQFWEFTPRPLADSLMFFTKQAFITSMGGDPDRPEGAAYLQQCSPLNHLEGIKAPLLLIHGQNDHIVAEKESRQIYESMKKRGKQVTYLLFPDEGHRIAKFANKMAYLDHAERFLAEHLGGKYDPVDKDILACSSAILTN